MYKQSKDTVSGCLTLLFCLSRFACTDRRATISTIVYFEWSHNTGDARNTWKVVYYIFVQ